MRDQIFCAIIGAMMYRWFESEEMFAEKDSVAIVDAAILIADNLTAIAISRLNRPGHEFAGT